MSQPKQEYKKGQKVYCSGSGATLGKQYKIMSVHLIASGGLWNLWQPYYGYKLDGLKVLRSAKTLSLKNNK